MHFPQDTPDAAEVGITLQREHQGQGYATEALEAVIAYLLHVLKKGSVYATIDTRNKPAIKLVERLGLTTEATDRALTDSASPGEMVYAIQRTGGAA